MNCSTTNIGSRGRMDNVRSLAGGPALILLFGLALAGGSARADDTSGPRNTQPETIPLLSPQEAAARITVPEGFRVSLFAGEPDVRQPIGIATDARGRLWVAENYTYAERTLNYDLSQNDRIVILEDTDHDGRADKRTVFWDKAKRLTSVEPGFGGLWALCPPHLVFIPDRNGDDIPDGEPEVMLEGWDSGAVRHNIANGLRWGPDGWLYGRHGIQATSRVGPPGSLPDQRVALNCAIWRFHPTRHTFEVVCQGTTNSWGMDWNSAGELFFINTVIGHLWHAVPGAHFERMYGEDFNPHLYALMRQTADHVHWDTAEVWSDIRKLGVTPTTDRAGGGHAHSGLMFYLGDNWPDRYRDTLFTVNLHGRRLNNDILERRGSGYVGRHGADFLKSADPWFRALELIYGPDGGVYLADWSDIGECHEDDGVHRSSGRIFKISYGEPRRPKQTDLATLSDTELVALQLHKNDWYVRQSRRILQERAAARQPMESVHRAFRAIYDNDPDPSHKLRAMSCLFVCGGTSQSWLLDQLSHADEHIRSWAVRLLVDEETPTPPADVARAFSSRAAGESSGLVLTYIASALQRLPLKERWATAEALVAHSEFAGDPALPLLVWYGIEPAVVEEPGKAISLAMSSRMPTVTQFVARRLTENIAQAPQPVDRLVALVARCDDLDRKRAVLSGMANALRGWRRAPVPDSWQDAQQPLAKDGDHALGRLVRELSVVFGDGRALDELLSLAESKTEPVGTRRDALRILVDAQDPRIVALLRSLASDRDLSADAVRGLARFDDAATPKLLLSRFHSLPVSGRTEAIVTLCSRPAWAKLLLGAISEGRMDRSFVPAFQVRQMQLFSDRDVMRRIADLWPELRSISAAKRDQIARVKAKLSPSELARADLPAGREIFTRSCATCHTLFGQGGKIAPDLTGSQRSNLDYLLENVIDPAATVASDYHMSTVALADGRLINGIVGNKNGATLTVQTPTERLVLNRSDVEAIRASDLSLMPEGLLDVLTEVEQRDLIGYLMSPEQVPLPGTAANRSDR
jgi:putative membrane-bound dehydrogenase-like protein